MDSVKRRLVYVADENESLLNDLTGTPPTRQSRLSRLHITPSTESERRSSGGKVLDTHSKPQSDSVGVRADPSLLISYDGFLFADGAGTLALPRTALQASRLNAALKHCRTCLKQYIDTHSESPDSPSSSSSSSGTEYDDEEDDSDSDSSYKERPTRRARTQHARRASPANTGPSVADLREELREYGLPVTGAKAALILRLQTHKEELERATMLQHASPEPAVMAAVEEEMSADELEEEVSRETSSSTPFTDADYVSLPSKSSTVIESRLRSVSLAESATSRTSTGSRSLWGAIVDVSSRIFRQATSPHHSAGDTDEISLKRRRSM